MARPSVGTQSPKAVKTHGTPPGTIVDFCAQRPTALMPLAFDGFVALSGLAWPDRQIGVEYDRDMCRASMVPALSGSHRTDVSRGLGDTSQRASWRKPAEQPWTSAQPDWRRPSPCSAVRRYGAVAELIGRTMGAVASWFGPDGAMASAKSADHTLSLP